MPHDVFLSYTRVDEKTPPGWVSSFLEHLETRLLAVGRHSHAIYWDRSHEGNEPIDKHLEALRECAALVCVVTRAFLDSGWCREELDLFSQRADVPLDAVFPVHKLPVALEDLPEPLKRQAGYCFHTLTAAQNPIEIHRDEKDYWAALNDLTHGLVRFLHRKTPPGSAPTKTVFLAQTTRELKPERLRIERELRAFGYAVLPTAADFVLENAVIEATEAGLQHSDLSVHLLGDYYGMIPEGQGNLSVPAIQLNLARRSAKQRPTIVWVPRNFTGKDLRQQSLVNGLLDDPGPVEISRLTIEELKEHILSKLTIPLPKAPLAAEKDANHVIYLNHHEDDLAFADLAADAITQRGGEPIRPLFVGSEAEIQEEHEHNMRRAHSVMLLWGAAKENWLRSRAREVLRSAASGRPPFDHRVVVLAGEPTDAKTRWNDPNFKKVPLDTVLAGWP